MTWRHAHIHLVSAFALIFTACFDAGSVVEDASADATIEDVGDSSELSIDGSAKPDADGASCVPENSETRESTCDDIDNDCDGTTDEGCGCTYDPTEANNVDTDGDYKSGVCVDQARGSDGTCSKPSSFESRTDSESKCNERDDDCDGAIDEGCPCAYDPGEGDQVDTDGSHSVGVCAEQTQNKMGKCPEPNGFEKTRDDAETGSSCKDDADNDCDGAANDGCPCDYQGTSTGVCPNGTRNDSDGSCTIAPPNYESPEQSCDALDNDCDGTVDDWDDVSCRAIRFIGSTSSDEIRDIAFDSSDNLYVVGWTEGSIGGQTHAGSKDVFVAKFDPAGSRQWVRLLGTTVEDVGQSISVDGSNIYITGKTEGGLAGSYQGGAFDAFAANYDASGNQQWLDQIGSSSDDRGFATAVDSSGNAYVVGWTGGTIGSASKPGGHDGFVVQYAPGGSRNDVTLIGTSVEEKAKAFALDSSDNWYVGGEARSDFGSNTNAGGRDAFLAKFDSSGNRQWVDLLGSSAMDSATSVRVDRAGPIYVGGHSAGTLEGKSFNGGQNDAFLAKYGSGGARKWLNLFGSADRDEVADLSLDSSGNVEVGGFTLGAFGGNTNAGQGDAFRARYDPSGNQGPVEFVGQNGYDIGTSIAVDSGDEPYLGGSAWKLQGRKGNGGGEAFIAVLK